VILLERKVKAMKLEELLEWDRKDNAVVFAGTRVPIKYLFEFLEDNQTLETFLDQFPAVSRTQAVALLNASRDLVLDAKK
jgi:Protein of unknown function (DUF433)